MPLSSPSLVGGLFMAMSVVRLAAVSTLLAVALAVLSVISVYSTLRSLLQHVVQL